MPETKKKSVNYVKPEKPMGIFTMAGLIKKQRKEETEEKKRKLGGKMKENDTSTKRRESKQKMQRLPKLMDISEYRAKVAKGVLLPRANEQSRNSDSNEKKREQKSDAASDNSDKAKTMHAARFASRLIRCFFRSQN